MSSKSKRGSKKPQAARRPQAPAGEHGAAQSPPPGGTTGGAKKGDDEEFVYVPRGKSKWTYIFILGLMVFTLIIFVVPGQFQALFDPRKDPANEIFMSWEHPRLGARQLTNGEFNNQQRALYSIYRFLTGDDSLTTPEATAAFLVTEALAIDAGVEVSDDHLANAILQGDPPLRGFGTRETYLEFMRGWGQAPAEFEAALRRVLRVQRYQALLGVATGVPDPDEMESSWKLDHEQYAFDVVSLAVADVEEAVRAELPAAEELQAWYEAQPPRAGAFATDWKDERIAAAMVGFRVGGENDAAGLLARFPEPQGPAPEGAGDPPREYYDRTSTARFRRPEPLTEGEDARARLYFTFDEVADVCAVEAPIHRALGEWLDELRGRIEAGEEVDLEQEAAELGLTFAPADEPRAMAAWREEQEGWGSPYLGSALQRSDPSGLVTDVVVDENGLTLARITERIEAGPAPYSEVAEKVADEWAKERAGELALEKLRGVYDGVVGDVALAPGERAECDAATLADQAAANGFAVQQRDWFDPAASDPPGYEPNPLEAYTRLATRRLGLEENQVAEPALGDDGEHAWLVRCAGRREPPEVAMKPGDLAGLKQRALFGAWFAGNTLTSFETYESEYGLTLARSSAPDEEEEEEPEG